MLPGTRQFESALKVLETLRAGGHEAYFAGGCVRDLLLGREPKDYDVATSATPDVVLGLFPRTFAVGAHFGVVLVATSGGIGSLDEGGGTGGSGGAGESVTEVATFRSDGAYSDGRHPDVVRYTRSAEEDVRRRDFTINGLLLDPDRLFPQGLKPHPLTGLDVRAEARTLQAEDFALQETGDSSDDRGEAAAVLNGSKAPPGTVKNPGNVSVGTDAHATAGQEAGATLAANLGGDPSTRSSLSEGIAHDDKAVSCGLDDNARLSGERLRGAVMDYVCGVADLEAGIVRAIGRAEMRFEEDHLRMLRAVRFAARFGFALDPATAAAIGALAPRIAAVSRERVRDELTKMLTEGKARRAFELLDETGLLREVLPEVARMKGVEQPQEFHPEGDVWTHTLLLLEQLEAGCAMTLAWGALLHDVGKPPTFRVAERIRFDGHVEVGMAMGAEICRRFRFSNDETRQVLALVENHMRFMDARRMKESTLKRFFRLESFDQHLALHKMDCLAASGNLDHWNFVRERYEAMPEEVVRPTPLITGRELIAAGYRPGAGFREMLRAVEDAQLEGTIATADDALRLVSERFAASGVEQG